MKTTQVIAFLLAVTAGILAIREAPIATVCAFAAAVVILLPIRRKGEK